MPREILAIDASTAILLAKVDLLRMVCVGRDAWMPAAALKEATVKGTQDARMISQLTEEGLIQVAPGEDSDRLRKDFRLHEGEAQTILLARRKGGVCATDDGPAIRCCRVLDVPFTTAIAFLIGLKEEGNLEEGMALESLKRLGHFGRYDPRILEDAARRIRRHATEGEST